MDRPSIIRVNFRLNESFFCIKSTTNLMNCLLIIFLPNQISNITLNIATIHFKNKNLIKTCRWKYTNCACAGWCSSCTEFFFAREEKSGNHARNFTLFVTFRGIIRIVVSIFQYSNKYKYSNVNFDIRIFGHSNYSNIFDSLWKHLVSVRCHFMQRQLTADITKSAYTMSI